MSRRYLTKSDREHIIYLHAAETVLNRVGNTWLEHDRPADWVEPIRNALIQVQTAQNAIVKDISDEDIKRTYRTAFGTHYIGLIPHYDAKKLREIPDTITIEEQKLYDLGEAVLTAQCNGCTIADHEACKYRSAMMAAGLPPAEDPTPEGVCQYRYGEVDEDMGTAIPNSKRERSRGAGPVTSYQLTPEEIAALPSGKPIDRTHHKPMGWETTKNTIEGVSEDMTEAKRGAQPKEGPVCGLTKLDFIKAIAEGETVASIERAWKMKNQTLPYWVKTWDLKGLTPDKARELLAQMAPAPEEELSDDPADLLEEEASEAPEDGGKDAEIERLREQMARMADGANHNADLAHKYQHELVVAQDENRKLQNQIHELTEERDGCKESANSYRSERDQLELQLMDTAQEVERLLGEMSKRNQPTAEVAELDSPQAFLSLALPLIDGGSNIEQRLQSLQQLSKLNFRLDLRDINTRALMDETLEMLQIIAGIVHARTADVVRPADVAATVQAFFSDHTAGHLERMQELAKENGWTVVEA
ncbi:DUF5651 domain-containing protein [Paenibacillus methanolicus]|uniref:DUF5651 domain-containing protein n=1 Tax=Paenibacillus methanolicus TaxID=582686 RepID=A0A5S5BRJ0_9BACL|nr:DUF5651 domain-containing protein [Paenibacillus methanolicus]TYP68906.1 hypothetical protein BCM02_11724 [Paenibacillus methanolicus]